jgi:hypothetical protein
MSDQNVSPSLNRLAKLTADLFPQTDEYGVTNPVLRSVDEKLAQATDLILEAQATLASTDVLAKEKASEVLADAKVIADEMVVQAKLAAELVVVKAAEVATSVLDLAKSVREAETKK